MEVLSSARANLNKENQSGEHHKQLQRLRVELNDRIFQLHKLTEDHAQEKAKVYIQLQKEKQLHAKTIKQLRDKIKEDNEGWVRMIDQLRKDKEEAIAQLKQDVHHKIQKEAQQAIQESEERSSKEIRQLSHKIAQQQQSFRRREEELMKEAKTEAQSLLLSARKAEQEKQRKHKAVVLDLKAEYEANLTKIQQMFVREESLRLQVQNDYQNAIKSHVREKIIWESVESSINEQIALLQEQISKKCRQIVGLNEEKRQIEQKWEAELQRTGLSFEERLGKLCEEQEARQRENCYRYSKEIEILKSEIGKLMSIHHKKEQSWLQSGKMVLQLYEKRESKKEDVKAIQQLQVQLIKRDFLIERQRKELKNCRLQLQNMEEIYDRIFIFNSNLSRSKTKSYQIKKLKASGQLNQSNRSTIISDKPADRRYPIQKSE